MGEKPILMSGPMVQATIREIDRPGTGKTQTRRTLKDQAVWDRVGEAILRLHPRQKYGTRFSVGDTLWVRETWKPHSVFSHLMPRDVPPSKVFFRADDSYAPSNTPWKPGIHMPRWASRILLDVTDVRVERLQWIGDDDAIAEGVPRDYAEYIHGPGGYRDIWTKINGAGSWEANPWVVATTFKPRFSTPLGEDK